MSEGWISRTERGSMKLLRLLTWLTLRLGRPIGRVFLYPICLYFIVFSRGTRRSSRRYLGRVLPRPVRLRDIFHHYHAFASTIHDRIYLLAGKHRYFDVHVEGVSAVQSVLERNRGCILLGSHLGSFEVLRAFGMLDHHLPLSVMMHIGATPNLNSVLRGIRPEIDSGTIPLGTPNAVLAVKERLDRGEMVGILGDRLVQDEEAVACRFLGDNLMFPVAPHLIAALLGVPVVLFVGLYRGARRYDIHFELLTEKIPLDRRHRSESIQPWVQQYVSRLEHYCRIAPYNWFNFYELPRKAEHSHVGPWPRARTIRRSHV